MSGSMLETTSTGRNTLGLAPLAATIASERSLWQSPVTYLFGGLAAMLGLIAIALMILACSYWRHLRNEQDADLEKGDGNNRKSSPSVYEEKIVVIMPGNDTPTYLANPAQIFMKHVIVSKFGEDCQFDETTTSDNDKSKHDEIN